MPDPVPHPTADTEATFAFKAGEYLFQEGERHGAVFVIESGQVELLHALAGGAERLALLGAGDVAGEDVAFGRRAAACSARAVADATIVKVPAETFEEVLRLRPDIAGLVIASIGRRLFEARVACVSSAGPEGALASVAAGATGQLDRLVPPAAAPRFTHTESGSSFLLPAEGDAVVGRADPRTKSRPDVELSSVDTGRSLSRRHATISRQAGRYFVTEEARVANGTFVNGQRLKAGEPAQIRDGDEVCFGLVRTVFRTI